jgi:hypothetical protein
MLMKFHVFGEVNKDYIVVQVEAQNRSWAKEIAQKENIGFNAYECVSEEWNNLYDKYKNLHQQCVNNDSFGHDNDDVVYSCNGYDITIDSLEPTNRVILDFYNDIDVRIYYLNEEEFSNVVEMLEIYATPDN